MRPDELTCHMALPDGIGLSSAGRSPRGQCRRGESADVPAGSAAGQSRGDQRIPAEVRACVTALAIAVVSAKGNAVVRAEVGAVDGRIAAFGVVLSTVPAVVVRGRPPVPRGAGGSAATRCGLARRWNPSYGA